MSGNVFERTNETFSAADESFAPTASPFGGGPPPKAAPALTIMYLIPYVLFVVLCAGMIFMSRIARFFDACCCCRRRHPSDNEDDNFDESNHSSSQQRRAYSSGVGQAAVVALGMRDRIRLYRRTFDKNKHFHILTAKNFRSPNTNDGNDPNQMEDETILIEPTCTLNESEDDINSVEGVDDEDPSYVYLPMISSESNCEIDDDLSSNDVENTPQKDPDAIYSSHTCETIETIETATTFDTSNESVSNLPLTKVSGSCIICFEKFRVGETVVWSDDTTVCKHVFHEDCMVRNLASHSKRTKRPIGGGDGISQHSAVSYSYAENPCPVCRRKFCTVRHDDLVMAVLLKSVAVALGEEEEDLPVSSRGGGEGSPFTSSERSQRIVATSYALASATMGIDSIAAISSHGDQLDLTNMSFPD